MSHSTLSVKKIIYAFLGFCLLVQPAIITLPCYAIDPGRFYLKPEVNLSFGKKSTKFYYFNKNDNKNERVKGSHWLGGGAIGLGLGYNISSDFSAGAIISQQYTSDKDENIREDNIITALHAQYYFNSDGEKLQPFIGVFAGVKFSNVKYKPLEKLDLPLIEINNRENTLLYGFKVGLSFPVRQNLALEIDGGLLSGQPTSFATSANGKNANLELSDLSVFTTLGMKIFI